MRQGKFIRDVSEKFGAIDDKVLVDDPHKFLLEIANQSAREHPFWYERFRICTLAVRGWRCVTTKTCSAIWPKHGG